MTQDKYLPPERGKQLFTVACAIKIAVNTASVFNINIATEAVNFDSSDICIPISPLITIYKCCSYQVKLFTMRGSLYTTIYQRIVSRSI